MLTDCHVHLDHSSLESFRTSYFNGAINLLRIFSNSTNLESAKQNLRFREAFPHIEPFVGIHPEVVQITKIDCRGIQERCDAIESLIDASSGIGEIGLDPKYEDMKLQLSLFERQLAMAESRPHLPISIHSRDSIPACLDALSRFEIKNRVLFHWFSGTESELNRIHSLGYYTSFGLPAIFSNRIGKLIVSSAKDLILAETDSPVFFQSISKTQPVTPFAITSVLFRMSLILEIPFDEMNNIIEGNSNNYLKRKTH
jgi:TatD DNase family protein